MRLILIGSQSLGNVDTVQEFTDILVLDESGLLNQSSRARDKLEIVALKHQLVLLLGTHGALDARVHVDTADDTLAQEVTDLDERAALADGGVDRKVSVHKSHLVLVALDHTLDHVLDVSADGAHGGDLLLGTEPLLNLDLLLADLVDVDASVLEAALESTARALDSHDSGLDKYLH